MWQDKRTTSGAETSEQPSFALAVVLRPRTDLIITCGPTRSDPLPPPLSLLPRASTRAAGRAHHNREAGARRGVPQEGGRARQAFLIGTCVAWRKRAHAHAHTYMQRAHAHMCAHKTNTYAINTQTHAHNAHTHARRHMHTPIRAQDKSAASVDVRSPACCSCTTVLALPC